MTQEDFKVLIKESMKSIKLDTTEVDFMLSIKAKAFAEGVRLGAKIGIPEIAEVLASTLENKPTQEDS